MGWHPDKSSLGGITFDLIATGKQIGICPIHIGHRTFHPLQTHKVKGWPVHQGPWTETASNWRKSKVHWQQGWGVQKVVSLKKLNIKHIKGCWNPCVVLEPHLDNPHLDSLCGPSWACYAKPEPKFWLTACVSQTSVSPNLLSERRPDCRYAKEKKMRLQGCSWSDSLFFNCPCLCNPDEQRSSLVYGW